jgi:hypothetical protein
MVIPSQVRKITFTFPTHPMSAPDQSGNHLILLVTINADKS